MKNIQAKYMGFETKVKKFKREVIVYNCEICMPNADINQLNKVGRFEMWTMPFFLFCLCSYHGPTR